MSIDLDGKRALVTGSTAGMGYAIARRLLAAGAQVDVHGRAEGSVASAVDRLQREHPAAIVRGHSADLADPGQAVALTAAVPDVDIFINNTGPTRSSSILDMPLDEWRCYLDTYVTAGMVLGRFYLRTMMSRGWGRLLYGAGVTCSFSPGDTAVSETMTAWLTAKSAMLGLSRGLAEVAAGSGVTVNAFIPGPTHDEEGFTARATLAPGQTYSRFEAEFFAGQGMSSLLARFIDPREMADAVAFLVSPEASAITGATLRVDGGIIRTTP